MPRVKLRPDTHYAPVSRGVYWSRANGRSFVLSGPATLYHLIDARLELLTAGTSVDELVSAVGQEAARPVFTHVIRTLLEQDILFDLAAAGPVPDAVTAERYADVLGYVESRCDHPYTAFSRLRSARIAVVGSGPAAGNAARELDGFGAAEVRVGDAGEADVIVLIDDADDPLDVAAAAAALPDGVRVVPVLAGTTFAVVGPVLGAGELDAVASAAARFAGWLRADGAATAPRPLSAGFAGSLAARVVLDDLLGLAGEPAATLIHGPTLECRRVVLSAETAAPRWRDLDDADDSAEQPPAQGEDVDPVRQAVASLTARWTGIARWGDDLDVPQLPIAVATLREVDVHDAGTCRRPAAGWGTDRADAGIDALLSVLRDRAADDIAAEGDMVAAAGTSGRRFVADGLLRLAAKAALQAPPTRELVVEDAATWIGRSLWSALTGYYALPIRLWLREIPGLTWLLATATGADGEVRAHQWGANQQAAIYAVLAAVTADCQLAEDPANAAEMDPMGTWALRAANPTQLDEIHGELIAWAACSGRRITGRLLANDPASGKLPLYGGWVGLR